MKSKASSFIKSRAAESVETRAYMVRNYQDGYPFLNLAFFFLLKISRDLNLFGKNDWSMNSGRQRAGDS